MTNWRRRVRAIFLATALVLAAVWIGICVRYVANPTIDPHERVDALYVLGPLEAHIDAALDLMSQGVAPVMVATTSLDPSGNPYFTQHCGTSTATYRIECVIPDPYSTRGEAAMLGELVRERGWTKVAVLASTPQASRARLWMERCVPVTVLIWDHPQRRSAPAWLSEFIHQSGGWVQAQFVEGCGA